MLGLKLKSLNKLPLKDYDDAKNSNPDKLPVENGIQNAIRAKKSKCQPLISVIDSIASLLNGNRVTAFVTQHASIIFFE